MQTMIEQKAYLPAGQMAISALSWGCLADSLEPLHARCFLTVSL